MMQFVSEDCVIMTNVKDQVNLNGRIIPKGRMKSSNMQFLVKKKKMKSHKLNETDKFIKWGP